MIKKRKYLFSGIFFCLLILATYLFILKDYDISKVFNIIKNCRKEYIFLAFLALFGYIFFGSYYLKRMLYHMGYKISFYQAFGYMFTGIYFSAITPSSMGGQPMQMIEMKKDNIEYHKTSILVLLNTMIYKIALIFITMIGLIFCSSLLISRSSFFKWVVVLGIITTILLIISFGILVYSKKIVNLLQKIVIKLIKKLKFLKNKDELEEKLKKTIKEYQECAKLTKKKPILFIEVFLILLCQKFSLLVISFFVYKSFGLSDFNLLKLVAFQSWVTLGSDLMPTPGGVMINEGLLLEANELIYGSDISLSAMILQRTISFYLLVVISGIIYMIFHFKKRKKAIKIKEG